jgi:hypothetical protein
MIGSERSNRGDEKKPVVEKEPPRRRTDDRRWFDHDVMTESACRGWGIVDALWTE